VSFQLPSNYIFDWENTKQLT